MLPGLFRVAVKVNAPVTLSRHHLQGLWMKEVDDQLLQSTTFWICDLVLEYRSPRTTCP